ncbi:MAG: ATP-binding cassette domain-containing protein, partial [Pseudomonadota bacterium]
MTAALSLDGLVKRFGGLLATNEITFDVAEGESVGLIGPNGAGKTTIFSLIMGEHRLNEGEIRLRGAPIHDLPTHERIKRGVARTYQVPRPFGGMTVAENIRIGLAPDSIRAMIF